MASVIAYAELDPRYAPVTSEAAGLGYGGLGYVGGDIEGDYIWVYESGRPRVREGVKAWMVDPKIKRPPDGVEWPRLDTHGMDVADLARRAGVPFGVASTVVQRHLKPMWQLAQQGYDPENYDDDTIFSLKAIQYGFSRKTYASWNIGDGSIWSHPSARNTWRYHSEGYVDRARPSGMANKRPEDMYRYITPAEKRVYMVMYAGKPTFGPEPYWSGSVSVEPPYPDSPHVLLPDGKWGPQSILDEILDRKVREQLALEEAERQRIAEYERLATEQAEREYEQSLREYQQELQAILDEQLRQQQLAETFVEPVPVAVPVAVPEPVEIFYPEPEPIEFIVEEPLPDVWGRGIAGSIFIPVAVIGIGAFLLSRKRLPFSKGCRWFKYVP